MELQSTGCYLVNNETAPGRALVASECFILRKSSYKSLHPVLVVFFELFARIRLCKAADYRRLQLHVPLGEIGARVAQPRPGILRGPTSRSCVSIHRVMFSNHPYWFPSTACLVTTFASGSNRVHINVQGLVTPSDSEIKAVVPQRSRATIDVQNNL